MIVFGFSLDDAKISSLILTAIITFIIVGLLIKIRRGKKNKKYFKAKWRALQANCKDKENWKIAIIQADDLLDEALKVNKIKGKTVGERLVSAQKLLSNNEAVWLAHKTRVRIDDHPSSVFKKNEVKNLLLAFGQAMKDLEVL